MSKHNWKDLREFIEFLKEKEDVVFIKDKVTPRQVGEGSAVGLAQDGPAIVFENVEGMENPIIVSTITTDRRFLWALGCESMTEYNLEFERRTKELVPPNIVTEAPCQEVIIEEDDVDLNKYCNIIWHEKDMAPFSGTMSLMITRDPDTGIQNCGIYRHENQGEPKANKCVMGAPAYTHARHHVAKYHERGEAAPFSLAVGLDPVTMLCGGCRTTPGIDEVWLAGALREEPVDVVKSTLSDILVPAYAEFIIEGVIYPDSWAKEESEWFGEFGGYYGEARVNPLMEIKRVTHRKDPIYQGTREQWISESTYAEGKMSQGFAFKTLRQLVPGVLDLRSCKSYEAVVQIKKMYKGHPQHVMDAVWGGTYARYKHCYVCDETVDIWDFDSLHWAMATRVDAARDITITKRRAGQWLDPAMPLHERGWQSGFGVDVTFHNEDYEFYGDGLPETVNDYDAITLFREEHADLCEQILDAPYVSDKIKYW